MAAWLASILGVVIVGIVVELLTQNRRMGNFIRSIYGFLVLLVIVTPLPRLLKSDWWSTPQTNLINTEMLEQFNQTNRQTQIAQYLKNAGYAQAIVTCDGGTFYVNLGQTVSADTLVALQKSLGEDVVIL